MLNRTRLPLLLVATLGLSNASSAQEAEGPGPRWHAGPGGQRGPAVEQRIERLQGRLETFREQHPDFDAQEMRERIGERLQGRRGAPGEGPGPRGLGQGRGFGPGRALGQRRGIGQGRFFGQGRGLGRGLGFGRGQRERMAPGAPPWSRGQGERPGFGRGRGLGRQRGLGQGRGFGIGRVPGPGSRAPFGTRGPDAGGRRRSI